jgi:predicted nucleotidyltransferase
LTSSNLAETLFGAYRRRVLGVLLLHPDQSFHMRELSRLTDVPAGSLHRELKQLSGCGLLMRWSVGNQVHFQANRRCPVFDELAGFFRKTTGLADVLREALLPLNEHIELAFVFGSVARGAEEWSSDVDVLVVGAISFEQVVHALYPTQEQLMREVNSVAISSENFRHEFQKNDRFIRRIVEEPKIFLIGTNDELEQLVQDRAAEGAPGR